MPRRGSRLWGQSGEHSRRHLPPSWNFCPCSGGGEVVASMSVLGSAGGPWPVLLFPPVRGAAAVDVFLVPALLGGLGWACLPAVTPEPREHGGWFGLPEEAILSHTLESRVGSDGRPKRLASSHSHSAFQRDSWGPRCPFSLPRGVPGVPRRAGVCYLVSSSCWAPLFPSRGDQVIFCGWMLGKMRRIQEGGEESPLHSWGCLLS